MKEESATPNSVEMTSEMGSGFDSSDEDTGDVDLSPLEISWYVKVQFNSLLALKHIKLI